MCLAIRKINYIFFIPGSSFDCGAVSHLPFKINYLAHDCAIQYPQIPFQFLGFRRLRGQLNPASPWIPDALFFPSQPVKAIPLESELWCVTVPRPLSQYFNFEKAREQGILTPLVRLDGECVPTSNFGNDVPWPPPPGLERQYNMSYSNQ
ncbi:hypothetical protein DFH08DRAFT_1054341 [Mycena albidolilacea]|uniref:Uncharacterized protein n=1 Tax=Mycena albidolilacea TaxID=1033008 RepID=A0AAD6Z3P9_9AGAR|nr:hypothetical protein DFH08DRAFT_1054341 [Mycena albidolilacea]